MSKPDKANDPVVLRDLLERIVSSAYGETTYPGGRVTTEVDAKVVNEAGRLLGFTRQIGV